MKTKMFRIACVAIVMMTVGVLSISAQASNYFLDKKYDQYGQVVSITKYILKPDNTCEKDLRYEYTYDDLGARTKKEVFQWNVEKNTWQPDYCITNSYDCFNNALVLEYAKWNKKQETYDTPSEKAIYSLNVFGEIVAFDIQKKGGINLAAEAATSSGIGSEGPILLTIR